MAKQWGQDIVGVRDDHLNLRAACTEPRHLAIEPDWQIVDRVSISRVLKRVTRRLALGEVRTQRRTR
jgi:hypothetical protein